MNQKKVSVPSTQSIEKEESNKLRLYREFLVTESSEELLTYYELKKEVESKPFIDRKNYLIRLDFKKSEAYTKFRRHRRIGRKWSVQRYLRTIEAGILKEYLHFSKSEGSSRMYERRERKNDIVLQKLYDFENSRAYKTYLRLHGSSLMAEYDELNTYLKSEAYWEFKTLCEDKNRWEHSDLYPKEKQLLEISAKENIKNYFKFKDTDYFKSLSEWHLMFADEFIKPELDIEKWTDSQLWSSKTGIGAYSNQTRNCIYAKKNVSIQNNMLNLHINHEKCEGKVWDQKHGFVIKTLDYSSAIISSGKCFSTERGLLKIKAKTNAHFPASCSIWFADEKNQQSIIVFQSNKNNLITIGAIDSRQQANSQLAIKGVHYHTDFHIYGLEWNRNEIIWSINNIEVFRAKNSLKDIPMHLNIDVFVEKQDKKAENSTSQIEYIKIFERKAE